MADFRKFGNESNIVRFLLVHSTTGQGLTGLAYNTSGLVISTITDAEAAPVYYTAAAATIEDITTLATFQTPSTDCCRFKEVSATYHPGLYEFHFVNARFAVTNARRLIVQPSGAANLLSVPYEIQLTQFDPYTQYQPVNLVQILGTTLTETAGQIAAGFKQFFNVASPTGTMKAITAVGTVTGNVDGTVGSEGTILSKLLKYVQLLARKDAAIAADNATELTAINANGGSGAGAYSNQTDGQEAIRDAISSAETIADAVWDEELSGHTTGGTAGKALRKAEAFVAHEGTAQAGSTASTIVLTSDASIDDNYYVPGLMVITAGTGAGQFRRIVSYNGTSKVATVATDWVTTPNTTSEYSVFPWASVRVSALDADVIDPDSVHADAVTKLQAGLSTSAEVAAVASALGVAQDDLDILTGADGAVLATNGVSAAAVAAAAAAKIADTVLRRSNGNVEASADGDALALKSLYGAVAMFTNGWDAQTVPGTLSVKTTAGTELGTQTLTGDALAAPVVKAV